MALFANARERKLVQSRGKYRTKCHGIANGVSVSEVLMTLSETVLTLPSYNGLVHKYKLTCSILLGTLTSPDTYSRDGDRYLTMLTPRAAVLYLPKDPG